MPATVEPPTAADLAWEATRGGLSVLEPEHRAWFEDAAAFVQAHWPVEPEDEGIPEPEDADELRTRLAVAETMLEHVAVALDLDEIDSERVGEQIGERLERERQEGTKDATIPSRANTAQRKALRLLVDGRIELQRIDVDGEHAGLVVAECKSESGDTYALGYDPHRRQWRCTCQELRGQCSHLTALKIVVAARPTG